MDRVTVAAARPRHLVEFLLMLLAISVGVSAYLLSAVNLVGSNTPDQLTAHIAGLVGIALIAQLFKYYLAPYADPVILPVVMGLTGLGLAMIYRIDLRFIELESDVEGLQPVGLKPLTFVGISVLAALAVLFFIKDQRILRRFTYTFGVLSLLLLILPALPVLGVERNGARIWITLFGLSLQPGEIAKITLAIFFAAYLEHNRDRLAIAGQKLLGIRLPRARDLTPIMIVWLLGVGILVLQRDLGTSLMFFGLFIAMLYVATNRVSWLLIGATLFVPMAVLATTLFPHVQRRFNIWLHAFDPEIIEHEYGSYQLVQALFGQALGGLTGTGWARGYPTLVSLSNSDAILSSFAEELGLTGIFAILLLYLILAERGMRAAVGVRDGFSKLLATGLSFFLVLQVFVTLGGMTRLMPLTGLTAPFLAVGGSSMLSSWIAVALLLRVSDSARRPTSAFTPWSAPAVSPAPSPTATPLHGIAAINGGEQ